jgi:hypothetical protein
MEDAISAVSQSGFSSQVSVAVLRKAMDAQQDEGEAFISMIRQLEPAEDGAGDASAGGLDLYA